MKILKIFFCLLFMACITLQAKERVIDRPVYIAKDNTFLEIEQLIRNDTATILRMKMFFHPNFWMPIGDKTHLLADNGVEYAIQNIEEFMHGGALYIPESGEQAFQLIFPPLPSDVRSVDLIIGEKSEQLTVGIESLRIWGVLLNGRKLPKLELPEDVVREKPRRNSTLSAPEFKLGKATLKGRILDYKTEMEDLLLLLVNGCIMVDEEVLAIDHIAEDGSFTVELTTATSTPARIRYLDRDIPLFLAPGEETIVYLNPRELTRAASRLRNAEPSAEAIAYYGGYMANISKELLALGSAFLFEEDRKEVVKAAKGRTLEQLRDDYLNEMQRNFAAINSLKIGGDTKQVLKGNALLLAIQKVFNAPVIFRESYIEANKLNESEYFEYVKTPVEIPEGFFEPVRKELAGLNSPELIYCKLYVDVVRNSTLSDQIIETAGMSEGFFFDLVRAVALSIYVRDFLLFDNEHFDALDAITTPDLANVIRTSYEGLWGTFKGQKQSGRSRKHQAPNVENEELFNAIIAPYRGKVIVLDFWSVWWRPCEKVLAEMRPLMDEFAAEDVVFIHIVGEDSYENIWECTIPYISGEHYRLSNSQSNYLISFFKARNIHTYMVVDQEGSVVHKAKKPSGVELMRTEIQKLLK